MIAQKTDNQPQPVTLAHNSLAHTGSSLDESRRCHSGVMMVGFCSSMFCPKTSELCVRSFGSMIKAHGKGS